MLSGNVVLLSNLDALIPFPCQIALARSTSTKLNIKGESGPPVFIMIFQSLAIKYDINSGFFLHVLCQVEIFCHGKGLDFVKCFLFIY